MIEFTEIILIVLAIFQGLHIGFSWAMANDLKETKKKLDALRGKDE